MSGTVKNAFQVWKRCWGTSRQTWDFSFSVLVIHLKRTLEKTKQASEPVSCCLPPLKSTVGFIVHISGLEFARHLSYPTTTIREGETQCMMISPLLRGDSGKQQRPINWNTWALSIKKVTSVSFMEMGVRVWLLSCTIEGSRAYSSLSLEQSLIYHSSL